MFTISVNDVERLWSELNSNSGMGSNCMHPRLLKIFHSDLSISLSIAFDSSLQSGTLPTQWLSSIIILSFKKSPRYDPRNYHSLNQTSVTY